MVYDISDRKSFIECQEYYYPNIIDKCKENIKVIVLGNKSDLEMERKVKSEEGSTFASQNGYLFMETSCINNENVADAFSSLIELTNRETQKKIVKNNDDDVVVLGETKVQKKKKCPC